MLEWDLSPLRPWEWWQVDAEEWTWAKAVRQAVDAGIVDANAEVKKP